MDRIEELEDEVRDLTNVVSRLRRDFDRFMKAHMWYTKRMLALYEQKAKLHKRDLSE